MAITTLQPFNLDTTANYTFANITTDNANLGNAATANFFIGSGNNLSNIQGANVTGAVSSATTSGTVTTNAQPNITSVGTLSSLAVTGNVTSGNIYANSGTIGASLLTGTVTTAAQPNITSVGTLSSLAVTGNLSSGNANLGNAATANFFIGDGSLLTNIPIGTSLSNGNSNVSIPTANGNVNISAVGNANIAVVTGTGVNVAGTLNVTGDANVGNIGATNGVFTSVSGNGSSLSSITGANVTGAVSFATTANAVAGANVSGQVGNALVAGTVYTAAQPNITSVGTLSSLSVTGNITSGNINAGNLLTANFITGTLTTAAQGNITSLGVLSSITSTGNLNAGNIITGGIVSATGNGTFGNVSATTFTGALSGAATTAGTVTTNAQPNITSVGSLTGLIVSNATGIVDFTTTANVTLGSVSNLHISGGSASQVLTTNGSNTLSWTTISAGATITDDTTTNASYYLTFANTTSGTLSTAFISSTKSYFNPSTGQLNATDFNSLSDVNYKTNIKPLTDAKSIVLSMTGVSFDWADGTGSSYGFVAQDLEQIIPHVVNTNTNGIKSVNYSAIIPFLVETIKQQQQQIDNLTTIVNKIVDADY